MIHACRRFESSLPNLSFNCYLSRLPHFPRSTFSTFHILHVPHFPSSTFSTFHIYIPSFLWSTFPMFHVFHISHVFHIVHVSCTTSCTTFARFHFFRIFHVAHFQHFTFSTFHIFNISHFQNFTFSTFHIFSRSPFPTLHRTHASCIPHSTLHIFMFHATHLSRSTFFTLFLFYLNGVESQYF